MQCSEERIMRENVGGSNSALDTSAEEDLKKRGPLMRQAAINGDVEGLRDLLDQGVDLNGLELLLSTAVWHNKIDVVRLLLARGAVMSTHHRFIMSSAIGLALSGIGLELLFLLLTHATKLYNNCHCQICYKLSKFSELALAIITNDPEEVVALLQDGQYELYHDVVSSRLRPINLAFDFAGVSVLCAFLNSRIGVNEILWEAVRRGDAKMIDLCAESPDFNPKVRNELGETLMHVACRSVNFDVLRTLIGRYRLPIDVTDNQGRLPSFYLEEPHLIEGFREIEAILKEDD